MGSQKLHWVPLKSKRGKSKRDGTDVQRRGNCPDRLAAACASDTSPGPLRPATVLGSLRERLLSRRASGPARPALLVLKTQICTEHRFPHFAPAPRCVCKCRSSPNSFGGLQSQPRGSSENLGLEIERLTQYVVQSICTAKLSNNSTNNRRIEVIGASSESGGFLRHWDV